MNLKKFSATIENFSDNDEVNYFYENYEFYASGMVSDFCNLGSHDAIVPFASTWKSGDTLKEWEYNDEFEATENDETARLNECLTFIETAKTAAEASDYRLYGAAFAHTYSVPNPDQEELKMHVLRIIVFLDDMPHGCVFYQMFASDNSADGFELIDGFQMGAKTLNLLKTEDD